MNQKPHRDMWRKKKTVAATKKVVTTESKAEVILEGLKELLGGMTMDDEARKRVEALGLEIVAISKDQNESVEYPMPEGWVPGAEYMDTRTGVVFVAIPAGEFLFGPDKEKKLMKYPFLMGKYTITWGQWNEYCDTIKKAKPQKPSYTVTDDMPVVNITWEEATAYCEYYGYALPSREEWEYAMRGTDGRIYPWGDTWDEKKCVCNTTAPKSVFESPSFSPFGMAHPVGNVWNFTRTEYKE